VNDNKAWVSPDTQAALDEFLNVDPYSSGKTAAQLADGYKQLEHKVGRDKLWNDTYLPRIKEEFDTLQQQGKVITSGGRKFLSETETRSLDRLKEQTIRDMVKKYGVGEEAEIRQYVDANMPRYEVTEMDELSLGSSGGSSQADKKPSVGFAEIGFDATVPGLHQVEGDGYKRRTPQSISMPLKDKDDKPFTESFRFNDNAGTPMRVIPDGFRVNDKGEVFIVGRNADVTQTQTKDAEKMALLKARIGDAEAMLRKAQNAEAFNDEQRARRDADIATYVANRDKTIKELADVEREVTKEKPPVPIPLKGNEAKVKTYFGEQVYNDLMQQAAAAKQTKKPAGGKTIAGF